MREPSIHAEDAVGLYLGICPEARTANGLRGTELHTKTRLTRGCARARVKRLCSPARPGIRDIARPRARTRKGAHPCPPRYAASRPERASSRLSERGPAPPPEPLLGELARDGRVAASRVDPLPSHCAPNLRPAPASIPDTVH